MAIINYIHLKDQENEHTLFICTSRCGKNLCFALLQPEQIHIRINILLVQPTKILLTATYKSFKAEYPSLHVEMIHEDYSSITGQEPTSVSGEIIRYLKSPNPEPHVLMITWEAFQRLEFVPNKSDWDLVVDEIPQSYDCFDGYFSQSHHHITNHLELMPYENATYSLLCAKNKNEIRRIAENKSKDQTWELFKKLAIRIKSPHWQNYVLTNSYNDLIDGGYENRKLTIFSFMKPSLFRHFNSVLIAGACFEESIFYKSFSNMGVVFKENKDIKKVLRYQRNQNSSKVTIYYSVDIPWSKRLRDKNDGQIWDMIIEVVKSLFADKEFVWAANKDIGDNLFGWDKAKMRLPQSPHGLNNFDNFHNVAYLSAHNLNPASAKFIQDQLQMTREEIDAAIHRQNAYQGIMRISTRNPEDLNDKAIFVPDLPTAEYLQKQLPWARLVTIDIGIVVSHAKRGRKQIHGSKDEKDKAYQNQLKDRVQKHYQRLFPTSNSPFDDVKLNDEITYINSNNVEKIWTSIFRNKTDKIAEQIFSPDSYRIMELTLEKSSKNKFK